MRSQLVLRRTRTLIKHPSLPHRALISSTRVARYPRKDPARATAPQLSKRLSSSTTIAPAEAESDAQDEDTRALTSGTPSDPAEPPSEDADKPKRRRAASVKDADSSPPTEGLPNGLDILWLPQDAPALDVPADGATSAPNTALPPPELLNEVLTNLYITLHPQTQHRAAYASPAGPPVEPTLALYCPIEGGDYIVDATVRELARQAGAEVVVLDAVHLAAGECGHFGKAASVVQLPNNPLHVTSPTSGRPSSSTMEEEDDDDDDSYRPSSVTLHVLTPSNTRSRAVTSSPRKSATSMVKVKGFFDELINTPSPTSESSTEPSARPPRIIYVRDFTTLSATSSSWYPALLAAVRSRRQGPLQRPSSPVYSPTTIVFGITPPIIPNAGAVGGTGSGPSPGLLSYLMSRQNIGVSASVPRPSKSDFSEDDASEKARERRLKERLRRWERGDPTLLEELPQLAVTAEGEESRGTGVVVLGGGDQDAGPGLSSLVQALSGRVPPGRSSAPEGEKTTRFYRTSFIVPATRSLLTEKACRVDRRREINELTIRMGVASVGGTLPPMHPRPDEPREEESKEGSTEVKPAARRIWEEWGRTVEVWSNVRKIADRAVGKAIAERAKDTTLSAKATLEPVPVDWPSVFDAWSAHKAIRDLRKAWVQHSTPKIQTDPEKPAEEEKEEPVDEVIERLKRDPDLDQHEQRLLGCIVDTATITTTFSHVHLPPKTIDSVRTIVSLPLLHPSAFQHGILKEHSMTGCLLFGPPGTGKTLVVRALAKEAGCRMLAVSPSDVMDMYVGEGEKLVKAVFSLARRLSPCVLFIDEIDALFGARSSARESGGAIAHRGVLTEFMQEMDGLRSSKDDNIIVIGATNRPFDLDDAILRRLPRRLLVDLPGEKEREEILKILLRDEKFAADVDLKQLAKKTESFSGSDLKNLCVSAALDAVKERVEVPWRPGKPASAPTVDAATAEATAATPSIPAEPLTTTTASEPQLNADTTATTPETPSTSDTTSASTAATDSSSSAANASPAAVEEAPAPDAEAKTEEPPAPPRVLQWHNFTTALTEITPSSSEALGSLADLRKWNEEFGEGRKDRKHKSVWGKGKFGFIPRPLDGDAEGKVADPSADGKKAGATTADGAGAR
ncbi:AAA-domain-containing protein [Phanerochaete sordida]|uniref:AAA-domain-containing protein n=1 Tax=Phanerochaete sordida TaxID=48140 RepID=A0A9P3GA41_9APHY|nr:AAA-domain-containing protein [Phanerochaete sordida]